MRLLSRLDDGRKSGAIWYAIFRQSPNPPIHAAPPQDWILKGFHTGNGQMTAFVPFGT